MENKVYHLSDGKKNTHNQLSLKKENMAGKNINFKLL